MFSPLDATAVAKNNAFLEWFKSQGGTVHPAVGFTFFPGMGRGAIALEDIKEETVLFTLPRALTLSMRTSTLPTKFGVQEWKRFQLHKGWVGLILCMLWESSLGESSKWSGYLKTLPRQFTTPMFWSEEDLRELEGTAIFDKVGRAEAEGDYHNKLIPAIKSRPDLFPRDRMELDYSLDRYHIIGSCILSRSFHVEKWEDEEEHEGDISIETQGSNAMDVDDNEEQAPGEEAEAEDSDDDSDEEDPSDVAMVPLADALNARYGSENAKLHYETDDLQMISTKDIKEGEQIWNTYGDPPNSDLLRRYGHVDLVQMENGLQGNPADIVEIPANLVVEVVRIRNRKNEDTYTERIDWWLEEGGDDVFTMESDLQVSEPMVSLVLLLSMNEADWKTTQSKRKLPKPKIDPTILQVARVVFEKRLEAYKTSTEDDEALLKDGLEMLGQNKYNAVVVRLGEKRILKGAIRELVLMSKSGMPDKKRGAEEYGRGSKKKSRH